MDPKTTKRFFISGMNKSGTTFLQMLLNAHPHIGCPSEQHFNTLINGIPQVSNLYNANLELFDKNTSRQGTGFNKGDFTRYLLKSSIDYLFSFPLRLKEGIQHVGLNDNSLIENVELLSNLAPDAKYLFIIRDPRDIGISLWHHKMRTEADFPKANIPMKATVKAVAKGWETIVNNTLTFKSRFPNKVHIVRYEDLVSSEREGFLKEILDFLEADNNDDIIDSMFEATSFDKLKSRAASKTTETDQSFFRSGKKGGWRENLDDESKTLVSQQINATLQQLNYPAE